MHRDSESGYCLGSFTISLRERAWKAYTDHNLCTDEIKAELLHEYIHYLQDTATYYGTIYRRQTLSNSVDDAVKGCTADELFTPNWFGGQYTIVDNRPAFVDPCTGKSLPLGSLALKESMAQEAQRYVYGENVTSGSQAVYYRGIMDIIIGYLPFTEDMPLLRFCIEDCCLMTADPSKSLLILLEDLPNTNLETKLASLNDVDLINLVYNTCENILTGKGLLCYDKINELNIDSNEEAHATAERITGSLYPDEHSWKADMVCFNNVAKCINNSRINNLRLRQNAHSIIARLLYTYSTSHDMKDFYNQFGMPVIRTEINGKIVSNKDDFRARVSSSANR